MGILNRLLNLVAIAPLVLLVLLVNAAVIGRYGFSMPIRWAEEVSGILMIWLVMLGAIVTERDHAHLRIPVLIEALPEKFGFPIRLLSSALSIGTLGAFTWISYGLAASVTYKVTDLLRISYWWLDIALCIGFAAMALLMAVRLARAVRSRKPDEGL